MTRDRPADATDKRGRRRHLGEELLEEVAALWVELAPHSFALFFHVVPHIHPLLVKVLEQTVRTPASLARVTRWLRPRPRADKPSP